MSSLDRLIDLAKKTGDRLIVHDPIEERDVVIMDIDEYERMALPKKDVRDLSSREMLNQINRDIAIWRANKEMEEQWEREEMFEDEMEEGGPFDPFAETDFHVPEWHSAGAVIDERLKDLKIERFKDYEFGDLDIDDEDNVETQNFASAPDFSELEKLGLENDDEDEEIKVEDLPFIYPWEKKENNEVEAKPVPQSEHAQEYFNDGGKLKEEPLKDDDEPVFYEEPV